MPDTQEKQKIAIQIRDCEGVSITDSRSHNMQFLDAENVRGLRMDRIQATQDEPAIDVPKRFWHHPVAKGAGGIAGALLVAYLTYRFGWNG
jgi:hypothetical protein